MAHQTEIVINGVTTAVTEFDHTAQEIDDMCDAAQSILPDGPGLPVSQGGTGATNPQAALAALGAGVRPNLLINPFFQVNQRGQTSYSGTYSVHTVDGWLLNQQETATLNVQSNGVQIVAGAGTAHLRQYLEFLPDGVYTVSFLSADGSMGYAVYEKSGTSYTRKDYVQSNVFGIGMQDTNGKPTAFAYAQSGTSATLIASKLESGEGQTLAYQDEDGAWKLLPQPESDYATQLAKCQRYYARYGIAAGNSQIGYTMAANSTIANAIIFLPGPMRIINPTVRFSGTVVLRSGVTDIPVSGMTINVVINNAAYIQVTASGLEIGKMYVLRISNGYIDFDADL